MSRNYFIYFVFSVIAIDLVVALSNSRESLLLWDDSCNKELGTILSAIPHEGDSIGHFDRKYYFVEVGHIMNRNQAQDYCASFGMNLTFITSKNQSDYLANSIADMHINTTIKHPNRIETLPLLLWTAAKGLPGNGTSENHFQPISSAVDEFHNLHENDTSIKSDSLCWAFSVNGKKTGLYSVPCSRYFYVLGVLCDHEVDPAWYQDEN